MTVSLRAKSKARCPYSQRRRGQLSLWDHPPKPASGSAPVFSLVVGPLRSWLIPEPRSDRGPNRTWGPWCVFGLLHPSLWAGGPASSSDRPRKVPLSRGKSTYQVLRPAKCGRMGRLISGLWFLMGGSSAQMPALCKLIRTNNLPTREPFFYRENRSA